MVTRVNTSTGGRFERLPIGIISRHLSNQVRGRTDDAVVNRYAKAMQNGQVFPPPTVAELDGAFLLVDGFHRIGAAERTGIEELKVEIIPCVTREEAIWLGCDQNLRHGLQLKPKRFRYVFRAYVEAGRHNEGNGLKSYRTIAGELPGVSYSTIRRWMEQDFPDVFEAMGGGDLEGVGGLPNAPSSQDIFAASVWKLLDELEALMGGIQSGSHRDMLAKRVRDLSLLWGGLDNPMAGQTLAEYGFSPDGPAVSLEQCSQRDAPF